MNAHTSQSVFFANDRAFSADMLTSPALGIAPLPGDVTMLIRFEPFLTVKRIQHTVAEFYHIPVIEMTSQRRARNIARPRQVAMYLAKTMTGKSLPDIGRRFGGRDHTTVIHAIRQVEKFCAASPDMMTDVESLKEKLTA